MHTKVPSPWTAIEFSTDTNNVKAKVWGREYIWYNSLLPVSIRTADREILSSPATLHALFGSKEEMFTQISYTPISAAEDKAVFIVSATAGSIIINIRYTIEYDGYLEMAMSVVPFANNICTEKLSGLYFSFPLTKESSTLFHFWPNGDSGIIQDPSVMASGAVPDGGVNCRFKPYFWCGWEFGGLGIATESDENIELSPDTSCITLHSDENGRMLRWNLLDKTPEEWCERDDLWTEALEPIDYIFGIQATPVKAEPADRTDRRIFHDIYRSDGSMLTPDENGENLLDKLKKAGVNRIIFHEPWSAIQNYGQAVNEELFKSYVNECHKRDISVMAYFGYEYATNAPLWHEKKNDYLIKTAKGHPVGGWTRTNPCQKDYMVCYAGGYAEGMRERVRYAMENYNLDGIYTDGTYIPWECANENHGCGYTDKNGMRHTTFPVFSVRRHVKALYELVHSYGGIIDTHQSSCLMAPALAFADSFYNGESIQMKLQEDFIGFLNLPAFRAEYMGKNIGLPPQMLAIVNEKMPISKSVSLSLIHDVLPRPWELDSTLYISKFWNAMHNFKTGEAIWHPYWKNEDIVQTPENVYCSVYEKDGKYLAAVSSFNETTDDVVLHFSHAVRMTGIVPGEATAVIDTNTVKLKIKAYHPELLELTIIE